MYLALDIMKYVWGVFLFIDQAIYNLIRWIYKIFLALAKLNLFDESDYQAIVSRIYVVLGVIMLFVLAYSLLKAVINPDDFAKGETSFPNLIKNIVISIIIIAVLPTVFTFALNVQNAILNQDTIGKVILNPSGSLSSTEITNNGGNTIAYWTFRAFFYPNIDYCMDNAETDENGETYFDINNCAKSIKSGDEFTWGGFFSSFMMGAAGPILYGGAKLFDLITGDGEKNITLAQAFESVEKGGSFLIFTAFANVVNEGNISYIPVVSTIVGGFELFILVSYCIALALRAVKLAFYQIIAPIPVICRVMPGDKKKIFDNWVKQIIGTFIDVFSRVAILYLGVYLISIIVGKFNGGLSYASLSSINPGLINLKGSNFAMISTMPLLSSSLSTLDPIARLFALAFIIVGILMFVKSAPNMIKDLLGIDLGGGLNPFKIFQDAGSAAAPVAGLASGLGVGLLQGTRNAAQAKREGKSFWEGTKSFMAGAGSAGARMAWNSRNAKNFGDLKKSATSSLNAATEARKYRAEYARKHPDEDIAIAHLRDAKDWLLGNGVEQYDAKIKVAQGIDSANEKFRAALKKQWEKHATDSALLFAMGELDADGNIISNQFKGIGNDQMLRFYEDYRNRNMSASAIKQDIEARRSAYQKTDFEALARAELGEFDDTNLTAEQVAEMNARCYKKDTNGNDIWDDEEEKKFINELKKKHEENIQKLASEKSAIIGKELAYLDSMYSQMEKFNITRIGEIALDADPDKRTIGSISASDLYDANQLGGILQETILSSGLMSKDENGNSYIIDPASGERKTLGSGGYAKSMDDIASAANNISSDASRAKQKFIEKKTDNH